MTELERNRYDYETASERERKEKKWMHTNIDQTDGKNVAEYRKKTEDAGPEGIDDNGLCDHDDDSVIIVGSPLTRSFDPSTCR